MELEIQRLLIIISWCRALTSRVGRGEEVKVAKAAASSSVGARTTDRAVEENLSRMTGSEEYPFQFRNIEEQVNQEMKQMLASKWPNFQVIESIPGHFRMPKSFADHATDFYRMKLREDDVFVATFPKCGKFHYFTLTRCVSKCHKFPSAGTTWTIEMAWLLMNGFDTEKAKRIPQEMRSPFLEFVVLP